ncbi:hypothetical protein [Verrucomicrobium sp. BvORR106]|uniref:hypothetical protein n=1 Tax=Verrucomicrobium sp. BvORR106 TaxID=1403819 RepID=UPI00056FE277|nr:hypothetical protein [Verrucomicrobium sp. BvORR106]
MRLTLPSFAFLAAATATLPFTARLSAAPPQISGIYPGLAMFNNEGECGTGAVVPWADRLWAITYAPHKPKGSTDKLYEITPELQQIVRPESVGGTPANRMIHRESNQLFIGPYAIDAERKVRVIPPSVMFGRHTGNARHLTDPAGKIYYATMEEGIYEVDVKTLAVKELWADEATKGNPKADLPGYHGKGLYSTQGRLVYANNGDRDKRVVTDPTVPSGALAEWDGKADKWTLIRRNQFTEVTGPGGIYGNENPDKDPIWSIGWDFRSLILQLLEDGKWHTYRLPKSSHSYDGAHGWNTEWPRIREIGEGDNLLMTMHGAMWKFPKTFSSKNSAGIAPRSNYLKVIGDFALWKDKVVFGCDDTANAEFLNKRKAKGEIAAPQSQSNLWFVEPSQIDHIGPVIGRGAVWMNDSVKAGQPSDAFLLAGYDQKGLHISAKAADGTHLTLEVDEAGNGTWTKVRELELAASGYQWVDLTALKGTWIRLTSSAALEKATAYFQYRNNDKRSNEADAIFAGLARLGDTNVTGGVIRAQGENKRTLAFAAQAPEGKDLGYYELDAELKLKAVNDAKLLEHTKTHTAIPAGVLTVDAASVIFTDDAGKRWRLPKGDAGYEKTGPLGDSRVAREVATERDLFAAYGSFFELPANNAGGFSKVRPAATSNIRIQDYCSYRGLFLMTGVSTDAAATKDNPHIIRSDDGKTALWAGAIDDIWKLGKPRGEGGPWEDTAVKASEPSEPYLMTAYDKKKVTLSHTSKEAVNLSVEVDVTGSGDWVKYQTFAVEAGKPTVHEFPTAFTAYWVRVVADKDATATATFKYE